MRRLLFFLLPLLRVFPIAVSPEEAQRIGVKIWNNECGGTLKGLTHWGKNENFPSLGIGHFIWYTAEIKDRFHETFPALLAFLQNEKADVPAWLLAAQGCPWKSRDEFYAQINSPKMNQLRQMLYDTRNLQALFIANRLEKALPKIIEKLSPLEKKKITAAFNRVAKEPQGLYALIDYVNFKGEGVDPAETYKGQGWGLLQVLQAIPAEAGVKDFVEAAKKILLQRTLNAPPERHEEKWLKGWNNRLETYL
jgi:hypothetical protein